MQVLQTVQDCLERWDRGGSTECRNLVSASHSNPLDPESNATLTTIYHALVASTLSTFSSKTSFSLDAFLAFVRAVRDHLPSSSTPSESNPALAALGEILVDIIWCIDSELEDIIADARVTATAADEGSIPAATVAHLVKAKGNAEEDKKLLATLVKILLAAGIVDVEVCRERLDLSLVANVGLIADKVAFERKEIRIRTAVFYKQNKFNLLREQSEGYSKLTAELTSSLGPPHSPATGYPTESLAAIEARARPAWEGAIGLIGYFDLDPSRALDVILDVFSVHLATHYRFFLALLSFSPWFPHSRKGIKQEDRGMVVEPDPERYRRKTLDEVLRIAEEQDGPRDRNGEDSKSRVLAQVLGFKFTYYQLPDVTEPTPLNLYLMTAILIREGFLTLEDIYPHLTPEDDKMGDLHKTYLASVDARIAGAKISQLAMAAPLESGGPSGSKARAAPPPEPKKVEQTKPVPNQRLGLLNGLLAVGALRPAIAILSKYPWLVDTAPELADLLLRILKYSTEAFYESTFPTKDGTPGFGKSRARYGNAGVVPAPERRPQLTLCAPTPPSTSSVDFVFFFPDWVQRIPVCSSNADLEDVAEPLLRFVGLHVSRDPSFLTKFLRLGRGHLLSTVAVDPETKKPLGTPDPKDPIRQFWFKVLRLYVLPSLPLIRGNAVCTVDVWNVVRQYETTLRWQLYGEWKSSTYKSHPELRVRQIQADREAKGILRRLSSNTADSLAGTVAKLAHSNPCIFFTNAINQIMAYDNMGGVVVQALNFVTVMGFDVLAYVLLDALANPNKDRVKDDGVNTSDWLQSLASFTGVLFRRFGADLTPLLTYIVHQLYNGQTSEIIVLRELIWKMAGIEPLPSLSDSQIAAMSGGLNLRIEAVASTTRGARLDPDQVGLKCPTRLGRTLLDTSLALPLLIQVAQQRQACVYRAPNAHLKSLASLFDTTHGVLLQYLELLNTPSIVSPQDYAQKVLPPLADLHEKYGICAPICMQIIRPVLNSALLAAALAMQEKERIASEEAEKRLKAALTAKREPNVTAAQVASSAPAESANGADSTTEVKQTNGDTQTTDVAMDGTNGQTAPENPWLPELYALFDDVRKIAPDNAAEVLGPGFYLTFWQMSLYDLSPPMARYDEECSTLRTLSRQEDSKYIAADRSADRAKRLTASIHKEKRNRINSIITLLNQELKEQTAARAFTIKRLAREKQHWFAHSPKEHPIAAAFVEHCLQPRCLLTPMDADFCAQFIKVVHLQGTPGFSTLKCYDKLLSDHVKVVVFTCSEYEARNYGRFLLGVLTDISKWFNDEQLYQQDNRTKSGGKTIPLTGFQWRRAANAPWDVMSWDEFQKVVRKWHRKLNKGLMECIQSGEFMHVYNAIVVLKEILPVFPVATITPFAGMHLAKTMEDFLEKEERGDLKILGRAYHAGLKKREPIWAAPDAAKGPLSVTSDRTRPGTPTGPSNAALPPSRPAALPSGPRAQLSANVNGSSTPIDRTGTPMATKLALDGVPRPEVVKRVRTESKPAEDTKSVPANSVRRGDAMDIDSAVPSSRDTAPSSAGLPLPPAVSELARSSRPATPNQPAAARNGPVKSVPQSPRADQKPLSQQAMPPPAIPSQTLSAQELRVTAKQSRTGSEQSLDRPTQPPTEPRSQPPPSGPRRSPSPTSRPGTRNPSSDSRTSGGRRSARGEADKPDEKRPEREARSEGRDPSRRDSARERRGTREPDRDKDGEHRRDRHGDRRERDRDRDRERERERDPRERERDGHRERDREKERDRHRRGEDKDRERESRREGRSAAPPPAAPGAGVDERGLPTRPDAGRHRADDGLGKRRRTTEEEDRSSKRSSRKDSHHEDRSRRSSEKTEGRESDRRRKERDGPEPEARPLMVDTKLADKPIPDGPASAKTLPPSTPSAPRAMTSQVKAEGSREWDRERRGERRDKPAYPPPALPGPTNGSAHEPVPTLRSRIAGFPDRDPRGPPPPQTPTGRGLGEPPKDRKPETPRDDDRDGGRKRTIAEREDMGEQIAPGGEQNASASKRPRLMRDRYAPTGSAHGLAKKLLPIDPMAGDKGRSGRKD